MPTEGRKALLEGALALGALCFGAASCGPSPESARDAQPERIVIVSIDTLRYDALAHMPKLRARAAHGRECEHYYSASSCTQPSHATLFTGLAPWEHGVSRNGEVLDQRFDTLAEVLSRAGFATAAVVGSLPLGRIFGFAQGFAHFRDEFDAKMSFSQWDGVEIGDEPFYSLAPSVASRAMAELDSAQGPRQFFFFHFFDAHAPYGDAAERELWSPGRILGESQKRGESASALREARAAYDADVEALDRSLDLLLERIQRDAAHFETHVFVLADHGESFGEGGVLSHGTRLTPEQLHVPLFVFSPRVTAGVESTPVGTVDVHATVLALAGLADRDSVGRDLCARSLAPKPVVGMRRTFAKPYDDLHVDGTVEQLDAPRFYLAEGDLLYTGDENAVTIDDQASRTVDGERAAALQRAFGGFARSLAAHRSDERVEVDVQKALRKLGYTR